MNEMKIQSSKNFKLQKLKIKFDNTTLDYMLNFVYKDSVLRTRKTLTNMFKLIDALDEAVYENEPLLRAKLWVIQQSLSCRLYTGLSDDEYIKQTCREEVECDELRCTIIDNITGKISYDEAKSLVKKIDDRLEFGYIINLKEAFQDVFNRIDDGDFKTYKAVEEQIFHMASALINIRRSVSSLNSDQTFSLHEDQFEQTIFDAVQRLKDRSKIFITGIQRLNTILSPGYLSKRLYVYLAFPGGGKSQLLLKAALDIKHYNPGVKTRDSDKTPAVLYITMENNIDETIERIYNMTVENDDIRNFTPSQIKKKLKEEGQLTITDKSPTNIIIKYYPNRSIDTNDLYNIIQDLNDDGDEVIALILDYVKRIRPAERADNEKGELKNITNELKTLATYFDIPVITAQQLNRNAASVVDAALQAKKDDVTRLVGRDSIAGAWEIIENADFVCILNQEIKADSNELYMTFKMLKRRYRSIEESEALRRLDYFNHPYDPENGIRLIDDVYSNKSLSLMSLSTTFVPLLENKRGRKSATERIDMSKEEEYDSQEFQPFDVDVTDN